MAGLCRLPEARYFLELGPAVHEGCQIRGAERVKPTLGAAFAQHPPRLHRLGKSLQLMAPEVLVFEDPAAQTMCLLRHDNGAGFRQRLKPSREIERLADGGDRGAPFRGVRRRGWPRIIEQDDDAAGVDADADLGERRCPSSLLMMSSAARIARSAASSWAFG